MNEHAARTPVHLWIVAVIAVLWNAMGVFDYLATQLRLEFYMSNFTPEQLDYFYGFPTWMVAAWAIAIWASFFGSVGLLLRKAWSVWLFGAAVAGLLISTIYNFVLSDGAAIMGQEAVFFTALIWVIALFLLFYARAMAARGVLRS
jgi:hypothetical protein